MTPASHPLSAAHTFSFNELYGVGVPPSLGNLSLSSGHSVSGPSSPIETTPRSPTDISHMKASLYTDKQIHENNAYIQIINRCRQLEDELVSVRQEHNSLKYVRVFLDYTMI